MPSSRAARWMRTAISPRLAIKSREKVILRNLDERLTRHDGLFIFGDELDDLARRLGMHFDEILHHLDQADNVADRDGIAFRFERRLVGRGLAIESAGER